MIKKLINVTSQTTLSDATLTGESESLKSIFINVSSDFTKPPEISFTGSWTGRDMQILPKLIFRAYKQHNLNKRKELANAA